MDRKLIRYDKNSSNAIKGIAILLVLFHHCFLPGRFENYSISFFPFSRDQIENLADMAKICVSMFAFSSGYGLWLHAKKNSMKPNGLSPVKWTVARYVKTFSGYWFVWIIAAIVTQLISGRTAAVYFKSSVTSGVIGMLIDFLGLSHLFGSPSMLMAWWYMSAVFIFIILVPLLLKLDDYLLLVPALLIVLPRILSAKRGTDLFTGGVYPFLFVFVLGTIFAKYNLIERIINKKGKWLRFGVEAFLLFVFYKVYRDIDVAYYWELSWGIFPVLVILFCVEFINTIPVLNRGLAFLGKHSLNIFLVHLFIKTVYLQDFTYSFGHFALIVLVLALISLCLSLVLEGLKSVTRYNRLIDKLLGLFGASNISLNSCGTLSESNETIQDK